MATQEFYTLLTTAGLAYEANRKALGLPIKLTEMSVGDGNGAIYNPSASQASLRREVWRGPINALLQDVTNPAWLVGELSLPEDVGGWYVREVGFWTDTGILYAVGKYPESYKPLMADGAGKEFYIRAIFETSNAASVVMVVDDNIVKATRAFVIDYVAAELAKLDSKQSVRAATTANIALSGAQTIDGVAIIAGDRVLVKNQASAAANGIYVAATGAWSRAADADSGAEVTPGMRVAVEQGADNADTIWMLTTDGSVTLGSTPLSFVNITRGLAPLAAANSWPESQTFQKNIAVGGLAELSNGTEDSPDLIWKTPLWKVFADVAAGAWRMFYEKDGTTKFPLMIDLAAEKLLSFGREVWTAANFDPASKLGVDAKAADSARLDGQVASAFLRHSTSNELQSGAAVLRKNNPQLSATSYGSMQLELRTEDGSLPGLGFHRAGFNACGLYMDADSNLGWIRSDGYASAFWTQVTAPGLLAAFNVGEIGSYAFLSNGSGVNYLPGDIAPATGLRYSSHTSTTVAVAVVGSWRCMGWGNNGASSVYMRVA